MKNDARNIRISVEDDARSPTYHEKANADGSSRSIMNRHHVGDPLRIRYIGQPSRSVIENKDASRNGNRQQILYLHGCRVFGSVQGCGSFVVQYIDIYPLGEQGLQITARFEIGLKNISKIGLMVWQKCF